MTQETRREAYQRTGENAVRSVAAWPRYMRLNTDSARLNIHNSDDPIDQEANRKKIERHLLRQDKQVKAMGLTDPNYKSDSTVSVQGIVITDHGSERGVLVEFNDGHRAWIPYSNIQTSSE